MSNQNYVIGQPVTKLQFELFELWISNLLIATISAKKGLLNFFHQSACLSEALIMRIPFLEDGSALSIFAHDLAKAIHDSNSGGYEDGPPLTLSRFLQVMAIERYLGYAFLDLQNIGVNEFTLKKLPGGKKDNKVLTIWFTEECLVSPPIKAKEINFDFELVKAEKLRCHTSREGFDKFYQTDTNYPQQFYMVETHKSYLEKRYNELMTINPLEISYAEYNKLYKYERDFIWKRGLDMLKPWARNFLGGHENIASIAISGNPPKILKEWPKPDNNGEHIDEMEKICSEEKLLVFGFYNYIHVE